MNEQNSGDLVTTPSGDLVTTPSIDERTEPDTNGPVASSGPPTDKVPVEAACIGTNAGSSVALLSREESEHFRTRWNEIQGEFVDEPRSAVEQADALVSEAIGKITQMFAAEHSSLESQWKQSNDISTEDLRQALQRYRSFFNRLVV